VERTRRQRMFLIGTTDSIILIFVHYRHIIVTVRNNRFHVWVKCPYPGLKNDTVVYILAIPWCLKFLAYILRLCICVQCHLSLSRAL
jgi:hypothetical protein